MTPKTLNSKSITSGRAQIAARSTLNPWGNQKHSKPKIPRTEGFELRVSGSGSGVSDGVSRKATEPRMV